jgi:transcriptional regulator GlxA family with amidase domain
VHDIGRADAPADARVVAHRAAIGVLIGEQAVLLATAAGPEARARGLAQVRPERTLKRRFKAATGLALVDYLQNLRIEEAKRLLESSDRPVEEISYETGYEDPSFFRRLFKRRTGVAPAQYRRVFKPIHLA